jgi:hypothetical protein
MPWQIAANRCEIQKKLGSAYQLTLFLSSLFLGLVESSFCY